MKTAYNLYGVLLGIIMSMGLFNGCTTPVGVNRVNEKIVYRQIDASALTTTSYSSHTAVVLHRHGLSDNDFKKDPEIFIQSLHDIAANDDRRDLLLALSELCFMAARDAEADQLTNGFDYSETYYDSIQVNTLLPARKPVDPKKHYLGAAVYAYLFLLGEGNEPPPGSFDRRFRLACELYNRSLGNLLEFVDGKITFDNRILPMPVGNLNIIIKSVKMPWDPDELDTVLPADIFEVYGLSVRNRLPGMGAPILAVRKKTAMIPIASAIPATAFLEVKGDIKSMNQDLCVGEVSILSSMSVSEISIGDKKIPLEVDLTAPIAYSFKDPILWNLGRNLIRMGRSEFKPGIYPIQPYEPGLIPMVLVHGTMSSPVWWSEMLNTLRNDPQIRERFQIWLYLYDSGKPVIFSATHLRDSIQKKRLEFDPGVQDTALDNMVIIGHSQGGLLTRLTAIDSGDVIVKAATGKSIDELDLSEKERALLNRYAVIHPLPEVRRVVFISTPHRGSILAGSLARRIASRLINLPREAIQTGTDLLSIKERFSLVGKVKWSMPRTSIDSMSPDSPMLLAIADLPMPTGIKGHSIIAIKGDEKPPEGDDGVVSYKSAHINGVESELVVPYGHSCQMEPMVIEEVRRILIEHLHETDMNESHED